MKMPFALLYTFNLLRTNLIKTIACILIAVVAPFLNSLKDIRNEDKIDYQYQKDGQYFYVTQDISNSQFTYEVQTFDKVPHIKNGKLISYSYNDANIGIWVVFVILCIFPIVGIFNKSDDDINFDFEKVFQATVSYYITCELEEGIYYYFYGERFLGKSDRPLGNEYNYVARAFRISNMTNIKSCPKWKTKTQNRASKLEEIGV
jgi:hypothetical protein